MLDDIPPSPPTDRKHPPKRYKIYYLLKVYMHAKRYHKINFLSVIYLIC